MGKLGGRPFVYGVKLTKLPVGMVPELRTRLEREANARNVAEGVAGRWSAARVAHETLAAHFGIALKAHEA